MEDSSEPKDVEIPDQYKVDYLTMSDGAQLRYLSYRPENPKGIVYMYPGMNTLIMSWIRILKGLPKENYRVEYVESREKHTAILDSHKFTRERMIKDCSEASEKLGLEETDYIALGSSLGSNTLIACMAEESIKPTHAILVGPYPKFTVPLFVRLLMPLVTNWTYFNLARPILKKFVVHKFTNEDADPMQKKKYTLAVDIANPLRLKRCLKEWRGAEIWGYLEKINGDITKCILIGATEDKLHDDQDTRKVAEMTENAQYTDLKTNTAAHSKPLIDLINGLDK